MDINKQHWNTWTYTQKDKKKKKNLDHVLYPSKKINSKWIIDLHIKGKAIKLRKLTCRKI